MLFDFNKKVQYKFRKLYRNQPVCHGYLECSFIVLVY